MIDAIACEGHFLDHLAPVWAALPASARGRFLVDGSLVPRARGLGLAVESIDATQLRRTPQAGPVATGRPTLVASIGDIKIGRRIGHGPFAFLEHGAGQAYGGGSPNVASSYAGGPDRADNAVFMVPNEYCARLWRAAYPSARVEIVGCPKLDTLPRREPGPPTVAISFHGKWPGVPFGGTALPDFANALPALAARFRVIGHAHPGKGWGAEMQRLYQRLGIEFVPEFEDVCRRADVYVCDNSSTIFEFAATGRPVVLLNAAHWRGPGPGGRFWDWATIGENVWPQGKLGDAVDRALTDPDGYREAREAVLDKVYTHRTGASDRAAAAIVDWLAVSMAAAA